MPLDPAKTKIISRKLEFVGWHTLETLVVQPLSLRHEGRAASMSREIYYCGTVAVILLYLPETDQVVLNEQFRVGAFVADDENPWLYECCAGMVDDGENPEDAARREALEETGCHVLDMEFIGKAYPSPGGSDEVCMLYCGRIGKAEAGHYGVEEEGEEIKTHLVSADEAVRMIDDGRITNASALICLHWFARNHERLRKKWSPK